MRRGAAIESDRLMQFSPNDIVVVTYVNSGDSLEGVVTSVNPAEEMVYVSWAGGKPQQHTPSELMLMTKYNPQTPESDKLREVGDEAAMRADMTPRRTSSESVPADYVGNPKDHGMDTPVGGGFSIVRDLVTHWRNKQKGAGELLGYGCRRMGAYHKMRGRYYRRTRADIESDGLSCPKCGGSCELQPFTRSIKLWICPECGWKISTDKVVDSVDQLPVQETV